jgi:hypothetical protein
VNTLIAKPLISGAIVMGYVVASLLFYRFGIKTQDRLFHIFALAFGLLGIQRLLVAIDTRAAEDQVPFYLLRLTAYVVILWALYDKNRIKGGQIQG